MEEEKEYNIFLDDSFDGLDEKINKRIINECEEKNSKLIEIAKQEGIENADKLTREEINKS